MPWVEAVAASAGLALAAAVGLPYLAGYGHHPYACWGPLLPCIANSKADLSSGIVTVVVSLALLGGLTVLAVFHGYARGRLVLGLLLLVAAVYWLGLVTLEAGIFVPAYALSAACVLATCAAAIATEFRVHRPRLKHGVLILAATGLLWFLSSVTSALIANPIGLGPGIATGPPDAWHRLLFSLPTGRDASGAYIGMDRATASELTRIHQGAQLRPLHFVGPDTPSTGPDVVSVNPLDRYTWSAVALSSGGRCYAILAVHDSNNPDYGTTYFGRFEQGTACIGASATPATVSSTQWPAR